MSAKDIAHYVRQLPGLPWRVRLFYLRAALLALAARDVHAVNASVTPEQTRTLIRIAEGCLHTAELGTANAWTAIALALADRRRTVASYDPFPYASRSKYLLLSPGARRRIRLLERRGDQPEPPPAEFLFIDSSHDEDETIAEYEAWLANLEPGAVVVFHDYGNPRYPGVERAIARLGLAGEPIAGMFVHRP